MIHADKLKRLRDKL